METVIRNVSDLDLRDRSVLERNQIPVDVGAKLPDWCCVYDGLTAEAIDEFHAAIARSHSSRIL